VSIDPDVPARVVLDGRHLRQILLNLLGNAIKFTAKGEVSLEIARIDDELTFAVAIPDPASIPANCRRSSKPSRRPARRAAGGTGLGLTISRHLLQIMGAELHVDSVVGEGSRFYFTLPLIAAGDDVALTDLSSSQPTLYARLAPGQQVTALVVDDSTVSRRILASLLESAGLQVITATGGLEGITLARDHRPDVIFMDVKMADLDGFSATRRLPPTRRRRRFPSSPSPRARSATPGRRRSRPAASSTCPSRFAPKRCSPH
jgi:hypothetical protein